MKYLGSFEELVLMAVDALGEDAYSANLQRTLEREARRPVSLGAVHSSLERLEAKRLLASAVGEPTGGRGGRRRRVFALTREGRTALRDVSALRQRLARPRVSVTK
jgi:PadR family transcriptional regulator, regulatory protein PadR